MSEASQAFEHANIHFRLKHFKEAVQWYGQAAGYLKQQFHVPAHVGMDSDPPGVLVHCKRCDRERHVTSVAGAIDFRDEHVYCREERCKVWVCAACKSYAYSWQDSCRMCGGTDHAEEYDMALPGEVLKQNQTFQVYVRAQEVATVTCRSLLRARRAARAMYPGDDAWVVTIAGSWKADVE